LFAEDDSKPGALSPILDWDVHFKEKIDLLEARGRTAYEAWKLNDKRQK